MSTWVRIVQVDNLKARSPSVGLYPVEGTDEFTIVRVDERGCLCGCGERTTRRDRKFRGKGHDTRLRGVLQRAHVAGVPITMIVGDRTTIEPAMVWAERLGWTRWLTRLDEQLAARVAKSERLVAEMILDAQAGIAARPMIGAFRMPGTNRPAVAYDDGDCVLVVYVMGDGRLERQRISDKERSCLEAPQRRSTRSSRSTGSSRTRGTHAKATST